MYVMITLAFIAHVAVAHALDCTVYFDKKTTTNEHGPMFFNYLPVINKVSVASDTTLP